MHLALIRSCSGGLAMLVSRYAVPAAPLAHLASKSDRQLRQYRVSPVTSAMADDRVGKGDLVKLLKDKVGLSTAETQRMLDTVLETIIEQVQQGKRVTITGFGTFEPRVRAARDGRNPATGAALHIPETRYPAFAAGKAFKDRVKSSK